MVDSEIVRLPLLKPFPARFGQQFFLTGEIEQVPVGSGLQKGRQHLPGGVVVGPFDQNLYLSKDNLGLQHCCVQSQFPRSFAGSKAWGFLDMYGCERRTRTGDEVNSKPTPAKRTGDSSWQAPQVVAWLGENLNSLDALVFVGHRQEVTRWCQ